jgi:hypothetical protein
VRRKSKRTRQLPKYLKKQIERANKKIKEWLDVGLSSNELRMAQKFFKDFYKANKKRVKNNDLLSKNILVTRREQQEYQQIVNYVLSDEFDTPTERQKQNKKLRDYWEDKKPVQDRFAEAQDKYNVEDEQDYIDFTDDINRVNNDRMLSSIMSSDQWAILRGYGKRYNMSFEKIQEIALDIYNRTGKTYDSLFNEVLSSMSGGD